MELRQMATAFLFHQDYVLMMKKQPGRISDTTFWSGLGGHVESGEWNHPRLACLREIYEESGIRETGIEGLELRYVLLRLKGDEIRQQFVYFGSARSKDFVTSEEGELCWIHRSELLRLPMSRIIRFMLEHYEVYGDSEGVTVGTITAGAAGEPTMRWAALTDPNVF